MSKELAEPKTLADLWFMRETSSGWLDGQIKFDNSMQERVEGGIHSIVWCVRVHPGSIDVIKRIDRYEEIDGNKASIRGSEDGCISYGSLEDFRASEWWESTMEAWKDGATDASWLNTLDVDGEKVEYDNWPPYSTRCIDLEVGNQYKDWLGNTRQGKMHYPLSISVDHLSGYLELRCGDYEVFGTVQELSDAMARLKLIEQEGIEVTNEGLTIKFHGDEE